MRLRTLSCLALAAPLLLAAAPAAAQQPADPYDNPEAWLCRPGRADLCAGPVLRTRVEADGRTATDTLRADPAASIDCFYIYPTISLDPAVNSGLSAGPGEQRAVAQQFAPFASVCRPYAPVYRQVTLAGLRALLATPPQADPQAALGTAYLSVLAAWQHYLKHDNQGRGVVLIGHSQGALQLGQLLRREIAGTPAARLIVSAILPGYNFDIPADGAPPLPLCSSADQTGCVISYASFKADAPPPAGARFGRAASPAVQVACVDPVALSGRPADPFLPLPAQLLGQPWRGEDWQGLAARVATPFVGLPGLLEARCVRDGASSYLAFKPTGGGGQRPGDIPAEILAGDRVLDGWGWHLVDLNAVTGNLLEIVRRQARAHAAGR